MMWLVATLWERWTHVHTWGKWQRAEGQRMRKGKIVFYDLQVKRCLDCNYHKIKKVRW